MVKNQLRRFHSEPEMQIAVPQLMKRLILVLQILLSSAAIAQQDIPKCTFDIPKVVKKVEGSGDTYPVFITTTCAYKEVTVTVFNRWGVEVYSSNNLNHDWKGKETTSGTYFMVIKGTYVDNTPFNITGYVTFLE